MRAVRILFLCTLLHIMIPAYSAADVKIILKNGRSFVADSCEKVNGRLLCKMQGGTMEIELQDIAGSEEVKGQRSVTREQSFEPADKASEQNTRERPWGEKKSTPAGTAAGEPIKDISPAQGQRLEEINKRKAELKLERERLVQDRQQLYEDLKNTGVIRTQEQFDAIKTRISDLETRITRLNEEVKQLNDEEAKMFDKGKTP